MPPPLPSSPPSSMTGAGARATRPSSGARVRSWLGDWLVIGAWLLLLTLGAWLGGLWEGAPAPSRPTWTELAVGDVAVTLATVVPFLLYLALSESSRHRATLGKRWAHLVVSAAGGGRPSASAVWTRNLVKVLPWQLAHLAVSRAILDLQLTAAVVLDVASLVLLALVAVPALTGGQGLHDRLAGTRVTVDDQSVDDQAVPPAPSEGARG
ncbi:RDD family protein [Ornithinimicrobium sp. LYQ121]|uniref:RDD family protein n=1 Tax=Ornithinimicrobium sp. LYQ121 TaxID=3378801 RepID=UPI0038539EB1